jgi:thiol-disulfide isomerase/thioredoxin
MKCVADFLLASLAVAVLASLAQPAFAADAPSDRVVAMYFHRTVRCPTCQKMGSYTEEAMKTGFAQQIKDGTVQFHFVNFQDENNSALTKGYKVSGPTLIVAKIAGNKVAEYKNLTEMWTKVRDKQAFLDYVQSNVKDYQK